MDKVSIDCNIFDELINDKAALERLQLLISSKEIEVLLSPTVLMEVAKAEEKHGEKLNELIEYTLIDESTSFPPFLPGKAIIGGDESDFENYKGNKSNPKRFKDPRILATLVHHKVGTFVTQNTKDFKSVNEPRVINFCEFKNVYKLA